MGCSDMHVLGRGKKFTGLSEIEPLFQIEPLGKGTTVCTFQIHARSDSACLSREADSKMDWTK